MQQQGDSAAFSEGPGGSEEPSVDGERPTMMMGLPAAQGLATTECLSGPFPRLRQPTFRERWLAGLWFGAAAAIPGCLAFTLLGGFGGSREDGWKAFVMMFLIPAAVAGLCGAWVGGRILSNKSDGTSRAAFLTGVNVTLRTMAGIAAVAATMAVATSHTDVSWVMTWLWTFLAFIFLSLVYTGCILIPFGGFAGCMLRLCTVRNGGRGNPWNQP